MRITLSAKAKSYIQKKGGRAVIDLIRLSSWGGDTVEVSVDTYVGRRDTSPYRVVGQDGVELLVMPDLASNTRSVDIDLKEFLFLRRLKAVIELTNGMVLGHRVSLAWLLRGPAQGLAPRMIQVD